MLTASGPSDSDKYGNIGPLLTRALAPNAVVDIQSCQAASYEENNRPSIAEVIAQYAPQGSSVIGHPNHSIGLTDNPFLGDWILGPTVTFPGSAKKK
jgi:hypothetical protein